MSSHREAPEISKDPVADNTDLYAFVSPDRPDKVTLIANFIPLQSPDGGPNFYEFGDDVAYRINIANRGKARPDIVYEFRFHTKVRNPETFLYNTGRITSITDTTWNRPQFYTVSRREGDDEPQVLGRDLTCPPVNIGFRSTPNYADTFTHAAVHGIGHGRRVFAGQRADAFFVDLGSIFDLGALRPFQNLHLIPSAKSVHGVNGLQGFNVHSIALQVPITDLTRHGVHPSDPMDPNAVIGVWASAHRRSSRVYDDHSRRWNEHGSLRQVSRLGNSLVNEVIIPMGDKDDWNHADPDDDADFAKYVLHPELAGLLPVLYPGVFPHLAAYTKPRADLNAILMTGIPAGVITGFQNFTGTTEADLLRLNVAIPPTPANTPPSPYGILGGDLAGYPNGRRLADDVIAISLRAVAGAALPLVDPSFTPDAAAAVLVDGTSNTNPPLHNTFPYLGTPASGYASTPGHPHT
ncbi:MAG TPA: DUF4331 domain-containing protein [Jatrophihabitans sp.]|jgi:hypothetical protein